MFIARAAVEEDMPRILEIEHDTISPPWTHGSLVGEIYRDDSFFAVASNHPPASLLGFVILRRMAAS